MRIADGEVTVKDRSRRRNSRENLDRLLDAMLDRPEEAAALKEEIDREFGEDRAVLALDMTGFSLTVRRRGLATFLLTIQRMRRIAAPIVAAEGGLIVKVAADNLYCLFAGVADAVAAARALLRRLDEVNAGLSADDHLYASIGIGFGRVLNVENRDIFGDEVNVASKLGEDVADEGMILLSEAARARLPAEAFDSREGRIEIAGLPLIYHVLA
jgi:adenylate cyclase